MKKTILSLAAFFYVVLLNAQTIHYANSVIDFSSEYSADDYSAQQILGEPDVYPDYGDNVNAWAHSTMDGQREYIVVGFEPMPITNVQIFETFAIGSVDTIYIRKESNGEWIKIFETTAVYNAGTNSANIIDVEYNTEFNVDAVRFAVNSPETQGWQEYDAVALVNNESSNIANTDHINLSIYPNPTKDYIKLCNPNDLQIYSTELVSLNGKSIFKTNEKKEYFDIRKLQSGIYLLNITTNRGPFTTKVLKQ